MFRKLLIGALGAMAVLFSTTAFAQGTASDAKAMLEKTVAAIKADKAKTLDEINKGENGFLVGDLYPFCFNLSDALLVAIGNPNVKGMLGKDARTFKDPTGDVYGPRLYDAAKKGSMRSATCLPRPALTDVGAEGELRYRGRRPGMRRRFLQVVRPNPCAACVCFRCWSKDIGDCQ